MCVRTCLLRFCIIARIIYEIMRDFNPFNKYELKVYVLSHVFY